jgi:hypothetical protein
MITTGCSDGSDAVPNTTTTGTESTNEVTAAPLVSPEERPADIPAAAPPIVQTSTLGEITRQASETPELHALRVLESANCKNDLLVIRTSIETIYAVLTCDKFSDEQFAQLFAGQSAALVLEVSSQRYRILIETIDGAQAELTPDGLWVE